MSSTTQIVLGSIIGGVVFALAVVAIWQTVRLSRLRDDLDRRAPLIDRPRSHRQPDEPRRALATGRRTEPQRVPLRIHHEPTAVMPKILPGEQTVIINYGGEGR